MSSTKRFKVGDKVRCTDGVPADNLCTGSVYTVSGESVGGFLGVEGLGRFYEHRFEPADPVFTDGREAFKPGDKVQTPFYSAAEVVYVSTEPREQHPVAVKFADGIEDSYRPRGLTKIPAEAPAPANPYEDLGAEIGRLVQSKQESYGDSFSKSGDVLAVLYPDGVKPEQYGDLLTITRILDKVFRIATRKDAFGESPYKDLAGYSLLAAVRDGGAK